MNKNTKCFFIDFKKENVVFVLLLAVCPVLAVTTSAVTSFGLGVFTLVVLSISNLLVSAFWKVLPNNLRVPVFIIVVVSLITVLQYFLQYFVSGLFESLGPYVMLNVVICITLGHAESFSDENPKNVSFFHGIGMGLGFTALLTAIGVMRELTGSGKIFGFQIMPYFYQPVKISMIAPAVFLFLALLAAFMNNIDLKEVEEEADSGQTNQKNSSKGGES